jgi:hypothetical protein
VLFARPVGVLRTLLPSLFTAPPITNWQQKTSTLTETTTRLLTLWMIHNTHCIQGGTVLFRIRRNLRRCDAESSEGLRVFSYARCGSPFFSLASSFLPLALISGEFSSRSHQTNLELEERLSYVGTILDLNVGKSSVASCKE